MQRGTNGESRPPSSNRYRYGVTQSRATCRVSARNSSTSKSALASSQVSATSTRLQVERIMPSQKPGRLFRSSRAAASEGSSNARRSRTSTGALLWFTPVIENLIW